MEPKTFNLTLSVPQINTIMAGLGELPFKASNELIQEIIRQFEAHQDKAEPPTLIDVE